MDQVLALRKLNRIDFYNYTLSLPNSAFAYESLNILISSLSYSGFHWDRPQISVGAVRELPLPVAYPSNKCCKYGTSSEANYILSLATAATKPYLLASADNQGTIKIWNLRSCLNSSAECPVVDEWKPDKVVRSVAFSADGCYLASAGGDGRAILWSLTTRGDRWNPAIAGNVLAQSSKSINSVDVIRSKDDILIVTGGDDTQINLYRVQQSRSDCQ